MKGLLGYKKFCRAVSKTENINNWGKQNGNKGWREMHEDGDKGLIKTKKLKPVFIF